MIHSDRRASSSRINVVTSEVVSGGTVMPTSSYFLFIFILFATLITKNIGKEEEEDQKRSGEET